MTRFKSRIRLPRELLEHLYSLERLSIQRIAERLGCGATTVSRALHRYGITVRTKRDYGAEIPRDGLVHLYHEEGLSLEKIGEIYHCSGRTIARRLQDLQLPIRQVGPVSAHTVPSSILTSWSPELAYAVGLLTADGSLEADRVRVEFVSCDEELIEAYCRALQLDDVHVVFTLQHVRKSWYKVKLNDRVFRAFLDDIGLMPNKSKVLGPVNLPDKVFPDFLRGVLDGDGSWMISKSWSGRYQYLRVELCTASQRFGEWVQSQVEQLAGLKGNLYKKHSGSSFDLVYMGQKALALGRWVYYSPNVLALSRKRQIWEQMQNGEILRRT